jgi:hypothetical protein
LEWLSNRDNVKHYHQNNSKPVYKYTKQGKLIQIYGSQAEAAGIEGHKYAVSINQCVLGIERTAYGYIWGNKELPKEHFIEYNQWVESNKRRVACYTKDGQLVKIYESASEARIDGYDDSAISNCVASKQKTHRKLIWKKYNCYVREVE